MHRTAAAILAVLLVALGRLSAGEDAALGTWDIVASTPDGPMASVMTVTKAEGKFKAEVEIDGTTRTVSDESLEGGVFKLKVLYEGVVYAVEGKISGNEMEGTWSGGDNTGTLTAKRRP
jgi:hypothetical protein